MADRRHAPFSRAAGGQPEGVNPLLFPPVLVKRALEDLGAIADVARRLPQIETALFTRVDGLIARIDAIAERIDSLGERLDGLAEEMAPIQNLAPVRAEIEAMHAAVAPLSRQMDELREEVRPIQQLSDVRAGIEPLDEDMHDVRKSIDELEPVVKSIRASIGGMDAKLDDMRGDLAPVGDLAEKVPGVGRR